MNCYVNTVAVFRLQTQRGASVLHSQAPWGKSPGGTSETPTACGCAPAREGLGLDAPSLSSLVERERERERERARERESERARESERERERARESERERERAREREREREDLAWGERIREMLSDMLYVGKIPSGIEEGITVLLPKIPSPLEWGETRPITLSSTFLKWAAQLLLSRAGDQLREGGEGLQWARKGRQGVELVTTLRRVVQMSKDWGVPVWIVKLDIRKAFDSVWQHSLAELVASRVGGIPSQRFPVPTGGGQHPWEAGLWLSILQTRSLNVSVGDVAQTNGIRQGSPDSPDLFGGIIAADLSRAIGRTPAQPADSTKTGSASTQSKQPYFTATQREGESSPSRGRRWLANPTGLSFRHWRVPSPSATKPWP